MNIKLTPEQEQIVKGELKTGQFRTAEEVIARALETFLKQERVLASSNAENDRNVAQETAVREMLAFIETNHVRLTGISVKDLIHEGHRL